MASTQRPIVFSDTLIERIEDEQKRLGISSFAEAVRYMCNRYLDDRRVKAAQPPPAPAG